MRQWWKECNAKAVLLAMALLQLLLGHQQNLFKLEDQFAVGSLEKYELEFTPTVPAFVLPNAGLQLEQNSTVHNIVATTTTAIDKNMSDTLGTIPKELLDSIRSFMNYPIRKRFQPPNTPGAFLHVGKTAGSTLTTVLENGCHSFRKKPCPNVRIFVNGSKPETYVGATTTYIHVPDFHLMGTKRAYSNFAFYVISIRDPFAKFLSSFTYMHPDNGLLGVKMKRGQFFRHCSKFYQCFPTLDQFAQMLGENPSDFEYPHPPEQIKGNCTNLAKAAVAGKVHGECNKHFYWNIKPILEGIPGWKNSRSSHFAIEDEESSTSSPSSESSTSSPSSLEADESSNSSLSSLEADESSNSTSLAISPPPILVIRTEHMNQDFKNANQVLGDPNPLTMKEARSGNDRVQSVYNVTKDISQEGRRNLCQGLLPEYKAYIQALALALNLSDRDRQASLELAQTNCPDLEFLFQKDLMTIILPQRR